MSGAVAALLSDGRRLHLQHGPIDLIIGVDGDDRMAAFRAAQQRFETVLEELVSELPLLRSEVSTRIPEGDVAQRMYHAVMPYGSSRFVTPMAAVAGSVADEILHYICSAVHVSRAYVNNGGDIALFLRPGQRFTAGLLGLDRTDYGRVELGEPDQVGGIATSGFGGRSLSLGIADQVTVLADCAANADVAATLIGNAVDLPDHPGIKRVPANVIDPDSDLIDNAVVAYCGDLSADEAAQALRNGVEEAQRMLRDGLIKGAALMLQGQVQILGLPGKMIGEPEVKQMKREERKLENA